jgi:hypothetical protein
MGVMYTIIIPEFKLGADLITFKSFFWHAISRLKKMNSKD